MKELALEQGTIRYRESGSGEPIVFVHGLLVDGELWRDVAPQLATGARVIVPDWPLGSQELPLKPHADLSPPALADLIADFIAALELEGVTLVANDTGGALSQLVVARRPERIARLVLTPCDAFEHFPPPAFKPLKALAYVPGAVAATARLMKSASARRSPLAYGWLSKRADDELTARWVRAIESDAEIRRQVAEILKGFSPRYTLAAAERFGAFGGPVLVAWAAEDRFFKVANAERLARAFPNARLELIDDSYSFVSLDQPQRTAELIGELLRQPLAASASASASGG
jgi:pimeloyl-ACP methyl ester carboxylesterase